MTNPITQSKNIIFFREPTFKGNIFSARIYLGETGDQYVEAMFSDKSTEATKKVAANIITTDLGDSRLEYKIELSNDAVVFNANRSRYTQVQLENWGSPRSVGIFTELPPSERLSLRNLCNII